MEGIGFVTWNMNWMSRSAAACKRRAEFIAGQSWDILALQEVVPEQVDALRDAGVGDAWAYPGDLRGDRFASALIVRNGFSLHRPSLIAELPQPRRGIWATAEGRGLRFDVASWHAPNAAEPSSRPIKQRGYIAFIEWAARRQLPLLVGTDANHGALYTREIDFPDSPFLLDFPKDWWLEENTFWTQVDPDLRDTWIVYLAQHPDVLAEVRSRWIEGMPSAVSYVRGSAKNPTPDRFDYVLATPEFGVESVAYDYEAGCAAGSDHGLVSTVLTLPSDG